MAGGYDQDLFVDQNAAKEYTCAICYEVAKNAHQTGCCGGTFCKNCIEELERNFVARRRLPKCPMCRECLHDNYFPDKISTRKISNLSVHCTNRSKGCSWVGELQRLDDHLNKMVECPVPGCRAEIEQCQLANHLAAHCLVTCPDCNCQVKTLEFTNQEHQKVCPKFVVSCPNRNCVVPCKAKMWRQKLPLHFNQCSKMRFDCPKTCGEQIERQYLRSHLEKDCIKRVIKCTYCSLKGTYEFINGDHVKKKCQHVPVPCPNYECKEMVKRGFIAEHRDVCPKQLVQCKYTGVCSTVMKREDKASHYKSRMEQHLESAWLNLIDVDDKLTKHLLNSKQRHIRVLDDHKELQKKLGADIKLVTQQLKKELAVCADEFDFLHYKMQKLEKNVKTNMMCVMATAGFIILILLILIILIMFWRSADLRL